MASDTSVDWLADELRVALNHLYDSAYLRKSPLVDWLLLGDGGAPAAGLRNLLVDAIESLKPALDSPTDAKNRRRYRVLYYRYVQQFTQVDVAQKLAMSARHLRREQEAAIRALAESVRDHYDLERAQCLRGRATSDEDQGDSSAVEEAPWLATMAMTKPCVVIRECLDLSQPLADRYGVTLDKETTCGDVVVTMAHTVLKQVLLNLVSAAVRKVPDGRVTVSVESGQDRALIDVSAHVSASTEMTALEWEAADVAISEHLVGRYGGRIVVTAGQRMSRAQVELPLAQQYLVLAIEDNADTLRLWERYVQQSAFRLVAVQDPRQALERAVEIEPHLIVLDVMLPGIDGWELLAQLQQHPATASIPVIICTVHPQRELAFTLGASDFVRKPTTRQAFLDALERQIAGAAPAPSSE